MFTAGILDGSKTQAHVPHVLQVAGKHLTPTIKGRGPLTVAGMLHVAKIGIKPSKYRSNELTLA